MIKAQKRRKTREKTYEYYRFIDKLTIGKIHEINCISYIQCN